MWKTIESNWTTISSGKNHEHPTDQNTFDQMYNTKIQVNELQPNPRCVSLQAHELELH